MESTPAAVECKRAIFTTSYLQTAAVFVSYGWPVSDWVPLMDGPNGRKRAQFEIVVPQEDVEKARDVELRCKNGMEVGTPSVGAYNRAFSQLKREIENEELRIQKERGNDDE